MSNFPEIDQRFDGDDITDVLVTPHLIISSWQYSCPTVLAGVNKFGKTSTAIMKDVVRDGA